jgi:IS5 family transposase
MIPCETWENSVATDDFFRSRLDQMIDLGRPLAVLAKRMPWAQIEASLASVFAHKSRPGKVIEGEKLFGTTQEFAAAFPSAAGRPRQPSADGLPALPETCLQCQR